MGEIAEYQDHIEYCIDCGEALVSGEAPTKLSAALPAASHQPLSLRVVATFLQVIEANAWRARLEAEGIPAFVADEQVGSIFGGFDAYVTGGVRLLVPEPEFERARRVLKEGGSSDSL
jgi:hypothetical protein